MFLFIFNCAHSGFLNLLNLWDYVMTDSNLVLKLFWNISMIWQEVIQILRKMPTHLIIRINVILAPYTLYQMSSNVYAFQYFSTFMATLMLIIHLKSGVMKVSCKVHTHMNTHIHTCNFFLLKFQILMAISKYVDLPKPRSVLMSISHVTTRPHVIHV